MAFKFDDPNVLLLGGNANDAPGALYAASVIRDASNHITGFTGTAPFFADAPYNDGGVVYGPGDVLFCTQWPVNQLGQMKPGSTAPDRVIDMAPLGVGGSSLAALNFVPSGFGGAGRLKLESWVDGNWYDATVTPDGSGTYDLVGVNQVAGSTLPGGPEGFVYVSPTSPLFSTHSILVSAFSEGRVDAYEVDGNGDPIVATRRLFLGELEGAEGALFDPLTGDFLFSTFGGGDRIVAVRGFDLPPIPAPVPEPSTLALLGIGLGGLGLCVRRRRRS
jgi:hypothetical protein